MSNTFMTPEMISPPNPVSEGPDRLCDRSRTQCWTRASNRIRAGVRLRNATRTASSLCWVEITTNAFQLDELARKVSRIVMTQRQRFRRQSAACGRIANNRETSPWAWNTPRNAQRASPHGCGGRIPSRGRPGLDVRSPALKTPLSCLFHLSRAQVNASASELRRNGSIPWLRPTRRAVTIEYRTA